ncbi:hypothetical protein KSP40_PGU022010 [Platanthera guangdongensis]|uniref:Uncharacterized protein n=1 Tax=Platanthera guangdongensis TaxID=2320717 RepID=A0ABR2MAX0_9ASPA
MRASWARAHSRVRSFPRAHAWERNARHVARGQAGCGRKVELCLMDRGLNRPGLGVWRCGIGSRGGGDTSWSGALNRGWKRRVVRDRGRIVGSGEIVEEGKSPPPSQNLGFGGVGSGVRVRVLEWGAGWRLEAAVCESSGEESWERRNRGRGKIATTVAKPGEETEIDTLGLASFSSCRRRKRAAAMSSGRLRFFPPTSGKKEREDELALFRELFKREREKNTNLLDAVSTELEPIDGNSVLYKISSAKKGDALANENEKNDYDWLKTPPATPLFQSLEMDVGQINPNMIVHKELPVISPLKPSRFSEKTETKTSSKLPSSPSLSSLVPASSSRPETPDPYPLSPPKRLAAPITTPRFSGTPRFLKESNTEASVKPLQPGRFLRRREEPRARPQSPGAASVGSASSRPETPNTNLKPPSIRRAANMARTKEDAKAAERSVTRFSKEVPAKQLPEKKIQSRQVVRPLSPSSRSVASAGSSRPETPVSEPIKSKAAPKSSDKAVKKPVREAPGKKNPEFKPNSLTASPVNRYSFPATHPDFPTEAPPNLITSAAPGRATSATRSRPGSASAERRRTPSVTKDRGGPPPALDTKGKEKIGGGGGVIGSSMVEKMMNARRSTAATGKAVDREDKALKMRGK